MPGVNCLLHLIQSSCYFCYAFPFSDSSEYNVCIIFSKGAVVGYGNLEHLKEGGIDILSMIQLDEEQDEGRSFSTDSLRTRDQQVIFRPKLKRHASYSPGLTRRMKHASLQDSDVHDPLLQINGGDTLGRTQSAHDLGMFSPDIVHNGRMRTTSNMYDNDYLERDEILSKVSV